MRFMRYKSTYNFCVILLSSTVMIMALLLLCESRIADATGPKCVVRSAPDKFNFRQSDARDMRLPRNSGIIADGFVGLRKGVLVLHGIDVSKFQGTVDYRRVVECGARFVYVRLSGGDSEFNEPQYRTLWQNARGFSLFIGPYHNLAIHDTDSAVTSLSQEDFKALLDFNLAYAERQAALFKKQLFDVLRLDAPDAIESTNLYGQKDASKVGSPYLPIAIDVSWTPQSKWQPQDRFKFGYIYKATICRWIQEINSTRVLRNQHLIMATKPEIYADYDLGGADCGLDQILIWVSNHSRDGDRAIDTKDPVLREEINRLCLNQRARDRCILEQYTSFGDFAHYQDDPLDLDRFYGDEAKLRSLLETVSKNQ
jgi:hypothetical protein